MAQSRCSDDMKCNFDDCPSLEEDDNVPLVVRLRKLDESRFVSGVFKGGSYCRSMSSTDIDVKAEYEQCEREDSCLKHVPGLLNDLKVEKPANTYTVSSKVNVSLPAASTIHFSVGNRDTSDDIMDKADHTLLIRHRKLLSREPLASKIISELPESPTAGVSSQLHNCIETQDSIKRCSCSSFPTPMECHEVCGSMHSVSERNSVSFVKIPLEVKDEPLDIYDSLLASEKAGGHTSIEYPLSAGKLPVTAKCLEARINDVSLPDRVKLLVKEDVSAYVATDEFKCPRDGMRADFRGKPGVPGSTTSVNATNSRKKIKITSDLVETTLEEDAPLLLKALIDEGVSLDEMGLYDGDACDDLSCNGCFIELEAVLTKIFSCSPSLSKVVAQHCKKGSKATYFIDCLIALVEQTRYSRFHNWPVEWLWCRDLQSFIFVFGRHNRIVLERPEYGYATYFFELVDSVPINWQIKRMVVTMKFTICSKTSLIEKKALLVGKDLSDEEATVMMRCGWVPNSGVGTMVNYSDGVLHGGKNLRHIDWRSKIGKLLADGYSGGTIVSSTIQNDSTWHHGSGSSEVEDSCLLCLKDIKVENSMKTSIESSNDTNALPDTTIPCSVDKLFADDADKVDHIPLEERRQMLYQSMLPVKIEVPISNDPFEDHVKYTNSQDAYMPSVGEETYSNVTSCESESFTYSRPDVSRSSKAVTSKRSRRKEKTATNSVETALEEDAPLLLKALIEEGISLEEMMLYNGDSIHDSPLDDSSSDDNFVELEDVITKLFSRGPSLLNLGALRSEKGTKACYYLACLVALVEQTRYLRCQRWPVEWGWCRDLLSFIFVFKRHNRIVLERPEYGYATYFFEIVDSVSISWQIKRLIIAMKFTNCSRLCLMDNKPLVVEEDLSEEEAKVLMKYGWVQDSGIGTMVNYRDRVVHDWRNGRRIEWRTKIRKLLADAYSGGTIVSSTTQNLARDFD